MNRKEDIKNKFPGAQILDNKQLDELIRIGNGSFKKLPNIKTLGEVDVQKSFSNLRESVQRAKTAYRKGFYIEMISLMLQHIDFHLRMYWVQKNKKGKIFSKTDKVLFGQIIKDCMDIGFNKDLANKIESFNDERVKAIHKYALGAIDYSDLKYVCDRYVLLDLQVQEYVHNEIAIPVYDIEDLGKPGDIILG